MKILKVLLFTQICLFLALCSAFAWEVGQKFILDDTNIEVEVVHTWDNGKAAWVKQKKKEEPPPPDRLQEINITLQEMLNRMK